MVMTENIEDKNKKIKTNIFKGLKIALNVIFYLFIILVLLFSIGNIRAKNANDKIPNVLGNGYLSVLSNSMEGTIEKGDLIVVDIASNKKINKLKVGDIVTFYDYNLNTNTGAGSALNTHRIVYIEQTDKGKLYYTVGDKVRNDYNLKELSNEEIKKQELERIGASNYQRFYADSIRGIYSTKLNGFGNVIDKVNNHFIAIIVIPVSLLLVLEIGLFIYNLIKFREEKLKIQNNSSSTITNEEIERIREEERKKILEEMNKKEN